MGKLDRVLEMAGADIPERPGSVRDVTLEGLTQRFETLVHQMSVLQGSLNNFSQQNEQTRSAANKSLTMFDGAKASMVEMSKDLHDEIKSVSGALSTLKSEVGKVGQMISAVPGMLPKPDLDKVIDAVNKIPAPKPVSTKRLEQQLLAILDVVSEPQESLKSEIDDLRAELAELKAEVARPKQWEFTPEREDFSDRISSVTAREIK